MRSGCSSRQRDTMSRVASVEQSSLTMTSKPKDVVWPSTLARAWSIKGAWLYVQTTTETFVGRATPMRALYSSKLPVSLAGPRAALRVYCALGGSVVACGIGGAPVAE